MALVTKELLKFLWYMFWRQGMHILSIPNTK